MKKMLTILFISILVFVGGVVIFVKAAPQFGAGLTNAQLISYSALGHFRDGKFINPEKVDMDFNLPKIIRMIRAVSSPHPQTRPDSLIPVKKTDPAILSEPMDGTRITWMGHSTLLIEISGKRLLIDPVFSKRASPLPFMGARRFYDEMPLSPEELPHIDGVLISHDHYDHLDYETILKLKEKTGTFFVPLGVGNHLLRWQVPPDRIKVADWWDEFEWEGLRLVFVPSRHFSGRGLNDRFTTLWGGWVIKGLHNIMYSGDGGYGSHFKDIGKKYGPFDLGILECGQYNENWADVHMMPEETIQAALDLNVNSVLPVHWGAFNLAPHAWTDPAVRLSEEGREKGVLVLTPRIGESFELDRGTKDFVRWWE